LRDEKLVHHFFVFRRSSCLPNHRKMAPQADSLGSAAVAAKPNSVAQDLLSQEPKRQLKVPKPLRGLPFVDLLSRLDLSQTIQLTR